MLLKKAHDLEQKKVSKANRVPFVALQPQKVHNAGFIVFKDKKPVISYTNDLAHTPDKAILQADEENAINCIPGLGPLCQWAGNELLGRTVFYVPAPIVAYNIFMNAVDIMDQC